MLSVSLDFINAALAELFAADFNYAFLAAKSARCIAIGGVGVRYGGSERTAIVTVCIAAVVIVGVRSNSCVSTEVTGSVTVVSVNVRSYSYLVTLVTILVADA